MQGKVQVVLGRKGLHDPFSLRHYPTYALLGFLFELKDSNAYPDVEMMGYSETDDLLAGLVNMEQMRRMGMAWMV